MASCTIYVTMVGILHVSKREMSHLVRRASDMSVDALHFFGRRV